MESKQLKLKKLFYWVAGLSILLPLPFHPRHDYGPFTDQWRHFLDGGNPYFYATGQMTGNAYGPLFNLLAVPFWIYSHLPHVIFICTWLVLSWYLIQKYSLLATTTEKLCFWFFGFFFFNPQFLTTVVSYGHFDILVAAFCVLAILDLQEDRELRAGGFLAIAVLFKYYPIVLLPFLALGRTRLRWRFLLTTLATVGLGMGASYLIWGSSLFYPLLFARDRPANFLSIFRFFRSPYSPWQLSNHLSLYLMVGSVALIGVIHWMRRRDALFAAITALFATFFFYKVNHPQFYTVLFYLVPLWWIAGLARGIKLKRYVFWSLLAPLLYVSFSMLLYVLTQGFKNQWTWMDDVVSVPFFLIQSLSLSALLWAMLRKEQPEGL